MGTEVLNPQDCLRVNPTVFNHRRRSYGNPNPRTAITTNNNNCYRKSQLRRRLPEPTILTPRRTASTGELRPKPQLNNPIASGRVTILRRGELLDSDTKSKVNCDNNMVPKQLRISPASFADDSYAGSAFFLSPSPRSLPLPSFFSKKQISITADDNFDDSATKDLRRLLRLG